jgi:hypothetical protein
MDARRAAMRAACVARADVPGHDAHVHTAPARRGSVRVECDLQGAGCVCPAGGDSQRHRVSSGWSDRHSVAVTLAGIVGRACATGHASMHPCIHASMPSCYWACIRCAWQSPTRVDRLQALVSGPVTYTHARPVLGSRASSAWLPLDRVHVCALPRDIIEDATPDGRPSSMPPHYDRCPSSITA